MASVDLMDKMLSYTWASFHATTMPTDMDSWMKNSIITVMTDRDLKVEPTTKIKDLKHFWTLQDTLSVSSVESDDILKFIENVQ